MIWALSRPPPDACDATHNRCASKKTMKTYFTAGCRRARPAALDPFRQRLSLSFCHLAELTAVEPPCADTEPDQQPPTRRSSARTSRHCTASHRDRPSRQHRADERDRSTRHLRCCFGQSAVSHLLTKSGFVSAQRKQYG
jgi:hypothetical protein